jgi:hypothetical protein
MLTAESDKRRVSDKAFRWITRCENVGFVFSCEIDEITILGTQVSDEALNIFHSAGEKALWEVRGLFLELQSHLRVECCALERRGFVLYGFLK